MAETGRMGAPNRGTARAGTGDPALPSPAFRLLQVVTRVLLRLLTRLEVDGTQRYPTRGPYIVVMNHLHWLDVVVAFSTLRHGVAAFTYAGWLDHWLVGPIGRQVGHAIPVRPGHAGPRALSRALHWLEDGGVILIAPEGERSASRALLEAQRGAAFLASRTATPVVPVAIWGQEQAESHWRRLRRPPIRLSVGRPIHLEDAPNRAKGAQLDAYTDRFMHALAHLMPADYRGVYAARD